MAAALLAQHRQRRLGDVDDAEEVGVDLGAEVVGVDVLDRGEVRVAGVVDDDVDAAEALAAGGDRGLRGGGVGDVEGEGEDLVGVGGDEVVELLGPAGGGDELVAGVEDGLGDRAAEAAARAGEEEDGGGGGIGGHLGSFDR